MPDFNMLLSTACTYREAGAWAVAARLYRQANDLNSASWEVKHNLALCEFALGSFHLTMRYTTEALSLKADLWQSRLLQAKVLRSQGDIAGCDVALRHVLREIPNSGAALLALADIEMNEYGDPCSAAERVSPLLNHKDHSESAELTQLMSKLYDREQTDEEMSKAIIDFSTRNLSIPGFKFSADAVIRSKLVSKQVRQRIGLLSPLFCFSPVYSLSISTLRCLAEQADLVFFNRGQKSDNATRHFRALASEWIEEPHIDATALANIIYSRNLDVLVDLGGWMDPTGLKALSTKPAPHMLKWVGGQSATTGLSTFDGFITDQEQSPIGSESLHTEPLIRMSGSYVSYEPDFSEPDIPRLARHAEAACTLIGVAGNPAKIGRQFIRGLTRRLEVDDSLNVVFIDRRFVHSRARDRIVDRLPRKLRQRARFEIPENRREYLAALRKPAYLLDTYPYNGGLTILEAQRLGQRVETMWEGRLFSSRHSHSHLKYSGNADPKELAAAIIPTVQNN